MTEKQRKGAILDYFGGWDREKYPPAALNVGYCPGKPAAEDWRSAPAADMQGGGSLHALYDGVLLYVEVDAGKGLQTAGEPFAGGRGENPAVPEGGDCLCIGLDFYGARGVSDSDGRGVVCVTAAGEAAWFTNGWIQTLSSIFEPSHPEYCRRLHSVWAEGNKIGAAFHVEDIDGGLLLEAELRVGGERFYWSHRQLDLYEQINHERPDSSDWGWLSFPELPAGAGTERGRWRIERALAYMETPAFQRGVWTSDSQCRLDECVKTAENALVSGENVENSALELERAILGLRWGDTRYPDPYDLPRRATLPNPFEFFDGRRVVTRADWQERRREILELAEFYEYGYRPDAPDSIEVRVAEEKQPGDTEMIRFGPWEFPYTYTGFADKLRLKITVGDRAGEMGFTVYLPDESVKNAPIVLNFDGDREIYRKAGFAVVQPEAGSPGDVRTVDYAWGQRGGFFYELFPYSRHGEGAWRDTGTEMVAAWCLSRVIDALERLCAPGGRYAGRLDPTKLAVEGFSIHGKYAFVSALYDERIGVCIPAASGASGLSPWRYVYIGQEYQWEGTPFDCGVAEFKKVRAFGTEMMANDIRHNPVRQCALFSRFLKPGRAYETAEGAHGYGLRLPFDQSCLAATMAGRAIVLNNTPNDFNDGSVADALTLEVIAPVYRALGYEPEKLLKYNYRPVCPVGDPHGSDEEQSVRVAAFLRSHFLGEELDADIAARLAADPFGLPVCGGRSAYEAYWGGFDAITDGWYSALNDVE